jgi:hypothetical protein
MNSETGRIYPSVAAALAAGVKPDAIVTGSRKALGTIQRKMRVRRPPRNLAAKRAARRRQQKASRRKNRS